MPRAISDLLRIIARHFVFSTNTHDGKKSIRGTLLVTSLKKEMDFLLDELAKNVCI